MALQINTGTQAQVKLSHCILQSFVKYQLPFFLLCLLLTLQNYTIDLSEQIYNIFVHFFNTFSCLQHFSVLAKVLKAIFLTIIIPHWECVSPPMEIVEVGVQYLYRDRGLAKDLLKSQGK